MKKVEVEVEVEEKVKETTMTTLVKEKEKDLRFQREERLRRGWRIAPRKLATYVIKLLTPKANSECTTRLNIREIRNISVLIAIAFSRQGSSF